MKEGKSKELKLNAVFEPLFQDNLDDPRYYQVYGGRGSGKSFAVALAIVQLTYSSFRHKILYLRQTMTSSEDSTVSDVRSAIVSIGATRDFREIKGVITNIKTKSTITFKGIKSTGTQTAKLKSLSGVTTLVVEEAEEVESFEEFSKIDESIRLVGKPLKIILIYNPGSAVQSWIHKEWFEEGEPKYLRRNDTVFLHSTYLDNLENLHESVVKRYEDLKRTNPIYYTNVILAEWTLEAEGRIYAGWGEGQFQYFNERGDEWYGLDFGYGGNDKTALVKVVWLDGVYYVTEVFSEADLSIRRQLTKMKECSIPFNARIYADSAVPELVRQIREGGYTSIRYASKGNKEAGIKKIQDKDIVLVGDDTTHLYHSYMTFRRDSKGRLPHEPDELAALRYAINSRNPNRSINEPTKKRIRKVGGFI